MRVRTLRASLSLLSGFDILPSERDPLPSERDCLPSERELVLKYSSSRLSKPRWCPWPAPAGSAAAARDSEGPLKACTVRDMGAPSDAMPAFLHGDASRLLLLLSRWPVAGTHAGAPCSSSWRPLTQLPGGHI